MTKQPSVLVLTSVGGCAVGAVLLLATPLLRIASAHTPFGSIVVRPGLSGGGLAATLCGLAAAVFVVLALATRNAWWLGAVGVPGLTALGWAVWYLSVRLPALATAAGNADLGPGAWCWLAGSGLLIAGSIVGLRLARVTHRQPSRPS